jgi:hypothetical protein
MGQWSKPSFGAGTWVIATRPAWNHQNSSHTTELAWIRSPIY